MREKYIDLDLMAPQMTGCAEQTSAFWLVRVPNCDLILIRCIILYASIFIYIISYNLWPMAFLFQAPIDFLLRGKLPSGDQIGLQLMEDYMVRTVVVRRLDKKIRGRQSRSKRGSPNGSGRM